MAINEKKYQKLFKETQADAIRFRKERDKILGIIRIIGRWSKEPHIVEACKKAIAGKELPNDDTDRIDAVIEARAAIEVAFSRAWRVSTSPQDYEHPQLRKALDMLIAANHSEVTRG